jgi:hypothetical protein
MESGRSALREIHVVDPVRLVVVARHHDFAHQLGCNSFLVLIKI